MVAVNDHKGASPHPQAENEMTTETHDFEISAWNYRALEFQHLADLRGRTQEDAEREARALRDKHRVSIRLRRGSLRWTFRAENPAKVLPAGLDRGRKSEYELQVWEPGARSFRTVEWTGPITREEAMDKARALLKATGRKIHVCHGLARTTLDPATIDKSRF